jgi:DNA-binding XRE family transcriptional regulator
MSKLHERFSPLAKVLCDRRYDLDLTQQAMADKIGCHQSMIPAWETGRVVPSIIWLPGICRAYGLSAQEIVSILENPAKVPDFSTPSA